jgi:hypothetical protein
MPPSRAVAIELVSANSLRKTGIFAGTAGDFHGFLPQLRQIESSETVTNARNARISRPFPVHFGAYICRGNAWLATQSHRPRLPPDSLQTRNLTGKITILGLELAISVQETTVPQGLFGKFPKQTNREISSKNTEF